MAYDLVFWTDTRADRPEPKDTYTELVSGRTVDGLGDFDTPALLRALSDAFPAMVLSPTEATGTGVWEAPDGKTVFEFAWSPHHLLATARGRYTNDQMNAIIDLGIDVGGGRLYDPQTDERFGD